jgi:hypothetical protein
LAIIAPPSSGRRRHYLVPVSPGLSVTRERSAPRIVAIEHAEQQPLYRPILKTTNAGSTEMETAKRRDPLDVRTVTPIKGPRL